MPTSKATHPWRRGRSTQFFQHLEKLPKEERQRIEAAERDYVAKRQDPNSVYAAIGVEHSEITRPSPHFLTAR